ncbi:fimbrial protein [Roseateles sp.]|uniref:fimbrial protein n=1 Tax=Roseateles sp. TaxID=1971397 RepID=UPI002E0C7C7D|nr:fimbrial protein [Roseateles sp.]
MMLMLLQWLLAPSLAQAAVCSSTGITLTPSTTNFFAPTTSGTFFTGTLTITATGCSGQFSAGNPWGFYLSFPFGTTASSVPSLTGLKIQATGAVSFTDTTNCKWNSGYALFWTGASRTTGAWDWTPGSGTCNVSLSVPIAFSKSAGTLTGSVAPAAALGTGLLAGIGPVQWAQAIFYGASSADAIPGPTTFNFFTPGCTLGVTNTSVTLPTVSKTSLASAGSTAGKKPFTLAINSCSSWSGGTYAVSMAWSFTPVSPTTDVISNTAATPAANVGVQLLDSTGASIANGSSTLLGTVPTSGGASFTKSFYAQYYATGAAGSGGVVGVASITLTYQ